MYIAKKDFNSMIQGPKKKGDSVEYNATFEAFDLIEKATETKPEQVAEQTETKPEPKAKKATKKKG